jgi:hypothetical protein
VKRVLRSLIDIDGVPSQENLKKNYFVFVDSKLEPATDQDADIWKYIKDFFNESREGELPSYQSVKDFFEADGRPDVLDRLKEIKESPNYALSNFKRLCDDLYDDQQSRKLDTLVREVSAIKSTGMKIGKGKNAELKKGVRHAVEHFISKADALMTVDAKGKLKGDVTQDGQEVMAEYAVAKNEKKIGRLVGLKPMDDFTKGLRPGELMLILGYVGELKSTLALNYAYNVLYFSLEMKYEQVRRILYCIHSTQEKFQRHNGTRRSLDYARLRDGELTPDEESLLADVVADFDALNTREYGKIIVERPVGDITVPELKIRSEVEHRKNPLSLIVADHAGLIEGEGGRSVNNYGVSLNYVLKDLSQFALNFNDGEGIPLCTPFQANRQGWKDACKNEGHYKLDALSWANEAERSASLIVYTFLGDTPALRDNNEVLIGCLKNRDGTIFKPFKAWVDFPTRRIRYMQGQGQAGDTVEEMGFGDIIKQ